MWNYSKFLLNFFTITLQEIKVYMFCNNHKLLRFFKLMFEEQSEKQQLGFDNVLYSQ